MRTPTQQSLRPSPGLSGDVTLRDDRAYKGLTPKQWAYCEARAGGMKITDAYRSVYGGEGEKPEKLHYLASMVEAGPMVQARLRELLFDKAGQPSLVPQIGRDFVLTGIATEAVNAARPADRLRAYELLGKSLGLFTPEREVEAQPKSVEELDRQLRERLASALAPSIEETARDVTPKPPGGSATGEGEGGGSAA